MVGHILAKPNDVLYIVNTSFIISVEREKNKKLNYQSEATPVNIKALLHKEALRGSFLEIRRTWMVVPQRFHLCLKAPEICGELGRTPIAYIDSGNKERTQKIKNTTLT